MELREGSIHAPRAVRTPPDPAWKSRPFVKDIFDKEREPSERD